MDQPDWAAGVSVHAALYCTAVVEEEMRKSGPVHSHLHCAVQLGGAGVRQRGPWLAGPCQLTRQAGERLWWGTGRGGMMCAFGRPRHHFPLGEWQVGVCSKAGTGPCSPLGLDWHDRQSHLRRLMRYWSLQYCGAVAVLGTVMRGAARPNSTTPAAGL